MTPTAVILDNDGLTLDSETVWTRAEITLFARRGREFTHAHKLELVGSAGPLAAGKLERMLGAEPGTGAAILHELGDLVVAELRRGCEPMPGALDLLDALRGAGLPFALCSNSPRRIVDAALEGSGLAGVFRVTVAGDEVPRGKPAPDPYLAAAAALEVAPGDCVALEDSPTGAASARAAGMRVIGVPSVPGVDLTGLVDASFTSLADPALRDALGLSR
jgi:HAD superfamily hydrolase (TIGR01509 family)